MTTSVRSDAEERALRSPLGRFIAPVTDNWWLLLVTGVAWLIVSAVIFRFDYTTVTAVSVLFGIVAIGAGVNEVMVAAFATPGWKVAYYLLAVLSFAVGIVSFAHPGDTFVALAALVSFYLIFRGSFDLITGLTMSKEVPGWWLLVVSAIFELLLGFWAAGSWKLSVAVLVAWVGATVLIRGVTEIVAAFELRRLRNSL